MFVKEMWHVLFTRSTGLTKLNTFFKVLHRTLSDTFTSASMSLVQLKVMSDYYSSKRVTPFFIGEDELLEYDFEAFKERLVREVPHLAKITSLSAAPLRITMNDEKNEVDLSPVYFTFQFKEMLSKAKNITLQAFTFESPSVEGVRTDQCEVQTNQPHNRPKHLPTLLEAPRAKR